MHEIKHDGYRLIVRRQDDRVRLFTRRGFDWTDRFARIVEAARKLKAGAFVIDGEAVVCGADGIADFAKLHSKAYDRDGMGSCPMKWCSRRAVSPRSPA